MKPFVILAALLCASGGAAAQHVSQGRAKHMRIVRGRTRATRPLAIPQQSAPPQEAFASFPEAEAARSPEPSDCDAQLGKIAVARPLGALIAPGECGAPDAVLLESVILPDRTKVAVAPPATLRCTMAGAVAQWVREDVAPAAAKLGAPLRGLENLGSYECRGRDRVSGATLSEHGRANALDVRAFKLANGKLLVLADPNTPAEFRETVRASACARFMTVLGPGADGAHSEHVHIDLEPRRNDYKICEWDVRQPVAQTVAVQATGAAAAPVAARIPADEVPLPRARPLTAERTRPAGGHQKTRRR